MTVHSVPIDLIKRAVDLPGEADNIYVLLVLSHVPALLAFTTDPRDQIDAISYLHTRLALLKTPLRDGLQVR